MRRLTFLFMFVYGFSAGQTSFGTLEECLIYAKQNNPTLKIENLNKQVSEQRLKTAWSALMPHVLAFGSLDDNLSLPVQLVPAQFLGGNEGEYAKVKFGTQFNASYGVEAWMPIINFSTWKNVKASAFAQESAEFQEQDRILNISDQLIAAYYFALLSREAIELNRELDESVDSLLQAAAARLSNGMIETLEYNRVKAIKLESGQLLRESKSAFQKNINTLKLLSGLNESDSLVLTERIASNFDVPNPTPLTISANALPRYKMFTARKLQSEEELKKQRSRNLPELSLYARYSRHAFRDEFNFFSPGQPWFDVAVAGVRAEWSLFTGFYRKSSIRQSSFQSQIAEHELESYVALANRDIEELRLNHSVAAEGLNRFREHYELNRTNHSIANQKYSAGIYSIDQYIIIYQEVVRSQNQYLNKLANYMVYESMVQSRNLLK